MWAEDINYLRNHFERNSKPGTFFRMKHFRLKYKSNQPCLHLISTFSYHDWKWFIFFEEFRFFILKLIF